MSVLNVIDTQTITASGNGYIVVKSGVLRVYSASASSIQIDDGPAITLAAATPELISCGKPKSSRIKAATDAATMVVTVDHGGTPAHTFAVGDYIATVDGGDTDGFTSDFESAVGDGKKVTAILNYIATQENVDIEGAKTEILRESYFDEFYPKGSYGNGYLAQGRMDRAAGAGQTDTNTISVTDNFENLDYEGQIEAITLAVREQFNEEISREDAIELLEDMKL